MTSVSSYSAVAEPQAAERIPELLDTLRNVLRSGRSLFGKVWGWDAEGAIMEQGEASSATNTHSGTTSATAGAASTLLSPDVQVPQKIVMENSYFTALLHRKQTVSQRIRTQLRNFSKRFERGGQPCFFSGESDWKSDRNGNGRKPREDLHKRSRYREKDIEFECVLADDSYLLDSYDRNGEYSRLTTERK
ncbi:MAG: hypothetical protein IJ794_03900 [Lachnospiraceae bacterium]|nr:hypothetical protein [Lachnospiraceae bacterium]